MSLFLIAAATIFAAVAAIFAFFFRGLTAGRRKAVTLEWISGLSAARYRPMERLLSEEDCRFVRGFPGADAALVRSLRAERRRIFRAYLRSMQSDFNRACAALRVLIVHAPEDRSELAFAVLKRQMAFQIAVARVEVAVALHAAGFAGVDVAPLVGCFEKMRLDLHALLPVPAPMAA